MADPTVKASGSADTQKGVSADVQAPQTPPAATEAKDPSTTSAWNIYPFGGFDYSYYDAGKGTDGLFSSGFGSLPDQTWLQFNAGFMTNVNKGKFQFLLGPLARFGFLRGGPQTNESKINDIAIGGRLGADWNRLYGFNGLRLFGRADLGYNLGYAFGESTANPSIRKYEQDAISHQLRGALEVIGWDFHCQSIGLNANAGAYIADGSQFNNTGMTLGLGIEVHEGGCPKVVQGQDVPFCESALHDAEYYWNEARRLQADNTKLHGELDSVKGYLEARPKNPMTTEKITKAQWLGFVESELGKMHSDKVAEIEAAADQAKKGKTEEVAAIFKAIKGMPEKDVDLVIKLADTEYPQATYDFYTHNLVEEKAIPDNLEQIDPKDCKRANAYAEEMRKIWEGYVRNNGVLTQKVDDIIIIGGLEGKGEVEQIVAASILDVNQPNFQTSRASPEDVTELNKYVAGKTNLTVDDAGLIKILDTIRKNNKAGKPTKVFGSSKLELTHLKELADWLNGTRGLDSAKDIEIKMSGGDPKDQKATVNESSDGIKKIREWQKTVKLRIEGHTDQRGVDGDPDFNKRLSQQRADAIRAILIGFGVAPERLEAVGYGESRPVAAETGAKEEVDAARAKNRRVVFRLAGAVSPSSPSIEEWGGKDATFQKDDKKADEKKGDKKAAPAAGSTTQANKNPQSNPTGANKDPKKSGFEKTDLP